MLYILFFQIEYFSDLERALCNRWKWYSYKLLQ